MMLRFDTEHLSTIDSGTLADVPQGDSAIVWTEQYGGGVKIKQPWYNRQETSNLRSSKVSSYLVVDSRKNAPLREGSIIPPEQGEENEAYQHYLDYWVGTGPLQLPPDALVERPVHRLRAVRRSRSATARGSRWPR